MKKALLALAVLFSASLGFAQPNITATDIIDYKALQSAVMSDAKVNQGLDWKVGDTADYKLKAGFINGTVHSFVREILEAGIWMQQDMDLGFAGKQKVEILFDKLTGQVLEILANGEKQTPPSADDFEVIEFKEAQVTVPAGSFRCVYAKILNKKDNKESEAWMNPQEIPMSGTIKQTAPTQVGKMVMELTAFNKQ